MGHLLGYRNGKKMLACNLDIRSSECQRNLCLSCVPSQLLPGIRGAACEAVLRKVQKTAKPDKYQRCVSVSKIRCLFDPWTFDTGSRIGFSAPGSQILDLGSWARSRISDPNHIFLNWLRVFSLSVQNLNIFQFNDICGYKKGGTTCFVFPAFCCCSWIWDPGWIKIRIRDPRQSSQIRNIDKNTEKSNVINK